MILNPCVKNNKMVDENTCKTCKETCRYAGQPITSERIAEYTYYYGLRPPGPGAQPRGFIKVSDKQTEINGRKYWGSVTYKEKLNPIEVFAYDLDFLREGEGN